MAGIGVADEEPVLLAHRGGADGVLNEVVVDFIEAIIDEGAELRKTSWNWRILSRRARSWP